MDPNSQKVVGSSINIYSGHAPADYSGAVLTALAIGGLIAGISAIVNSGHSSDQSSEGNYNSPCTIAKDYDGNVYKTVQIGNQCWMAENLKSKHYSDGRSIKYGGSNTSSNVAYWYYPGNSERENQYGLLYNWPAIMDGSSASNRNPSGVHGICPKGWHVPSYVEWNELTLRASQRYYCNKTLEYNASSLASTTGWKFYEDECTVGNNPSKNNASGFSAVPAGWIDGVDASYIGLYEIAKFWTSSADDNPIKADCRTIWWSRETVLDEDWYTHDGLSVRCVQD